MTISTSDQSPSLASRPDNDDLQTSELLELITRVFVPHADGEALAILVDLPDANLPDNAAWRERRRIAATWALGLAQAHASGENSIPCALFAYGNVRRNNADLPDRAWSIPLSTESSDTTPETLLPDHASALDPAAAVSFEEAVFTQYTIIMAPTELSATAPLKLAARTHGFRAATMGGFGPKMIPALRLDYTEIDRRCQRLKVLVDEAARAELSFVHTNDATTTWHLTLDLRHRKSHASTGLFPKGGIAGNLPSGETYIVPYEGEIPDDPSQSGGLLPVQLDATRDEIVVYRIVENKALEVLGDGPQAQSERARLAAEPAYGNLAELGLGVLADFGLKAIGEVMLDEKLGLHIAFGRSDHFGGQVGAKDFTTPEAVVHIDRVYVPDTMPAVRAAKVDLVSTTGEITPLLRDGRYVFDEPL
ncbi:MAG: hypothetical protein DRN14_06540 [Thermoplasmata archaeon]|nr:MAG: hypothetical protein DRN14_06540 [Thermoplasmata archaeon]